MTPKIYWVPRLICGTSTEPDRVGVWSVQSASKNSGNFPTISLKVKRLEKLQTKQAKAISPFS